MLIRCRISSWLTSFADLSALPSSSFFLAIIKQAREIILVLLLFYFPSTTPSCSSPGKWKSPSLSRSAAVFNRDILF
ncbi:hypothetical protein MRB53_014997 [Persea americana]|uniref:Uncharacterized protein n=1 Tax=Persea americana TaxID=3435 RepID=A0ACC2KCK5_PERAE|nr:hypothetical protein MRB53_014997 [Persea americana]